MSVTKRIRKRKDGKKTTVYQAEVYVRGIRVDSQYFDARSEAIYWHDKIKAQYESGHVVQAIYTLRMATEEYQESEFLRLRKSTQQARFSRFKYILDAPIANLRMTDLTAKSIDQWFKWLYDHETTKVTKGRKSFRQELKVLGLILNWYRDTIDESFVVPIVKRHRKAVYFKPITPRRPDYFIPPEDAAHWLEAMEKRPDPVYACMAKWQVITGWRLGETAGLAWEGIDLKRGIARVVQTMSWDYVTKEPYIQIEAKNEESIRLVKLPAMLIEMLADLKAKSDGRGLVFLNKKGNPVRDNVVRENYNAAFKACGLSWSATHICRHTHATLSLMATRDKTAVQANLGHSSSKQTDEYAKVIALLGNNAPTQTAELIGLSRQESR